MNAGIYEQEKTQIEYPFEKCSTPKSIFGPELMKCGKVFLCFISEDFVFCGLCENTICKFTIFNEFANHIKENHIMLDDPNNEPYNTYREITEEKESAAQQALAEFEIEYLHLDEEVEPKLSVLQWPDHHVSQFIDLYREQECLWNVESKLYHKTKVKEDAYTEVLHKFNELIPNVLGDTSSVKNAIKELVEFFSKLSEEQQQTSEFSSNFEIYKRLMFLKNVSKSRSVQNPETYACVNSQNDFTIAKSSHNVQTSNDINDLLTETTQSDCKTCPICRVSFENTKDLKIHLSDLSTNLQKKICDICGAKFKEQSNFITHLRGHKNEKNQHRDEMPFICETCGFRFKYLNRLETHKLLHGDPLFKCNDCNKKFFLKRQLNYHQRKHGPAEMESCDVCRKIFRNKDSLLRHTRKIHNIRKRASNLV